MSVVFDVSAYFPDRPPTWLEVGLMLLVAGTVAGKLLRGAVVSWPALALGFAVFALVLGPGTQSALGARVGQWFRAIGTAARGVVIVLFIVAVTVVSRFAWFPDVLLSDFGSGGLLAVVCYMIVYVARAGEVSGLTTGRTD